MERSWYWRVALVVGVALFSLYQLVPSWFYFKLPPDQRNGEAYDQSVPKWGPTAKKHLNLGLDLQGGIHLAMGVDVDRAVKAKVARRADEIADYLKSKEVPFTASKTIDAGRRIEVTGPDAGKIRSTVLDGYGEMYAPGGAQGDTVVFAFKDQTLREFQAKAVEQAEKVIRNRIDKWGVSEPDIKRKANSQIQIQLPGAQDPEQAKQLLGRTAQLEFRIVDDESSALDKVKTELPQCKLDTLERMDFTQIPPGGCWFSESGHPQVVAKTLEAISGIVAQRLNPLVDPAKNLVMTGKETSNRDGVPVTYYRTYLLRAKTELTGDYLADASVGQEQSGLNKGEWLVQFEMSPEGAKLMGKLTGENVNKRMAIVLDDNVESAPYIQSQITSNGQITLGAGRNPQDQFNEASQIALVLRSGALPAPVTIAAESTVGATLGPELVSKGTRAALIGLVAVLIFMVLYYRASGLVADVALALNGVLVLAAMAMVGSTLTLPGIAGFVLTLGMAVDANVLIAERIREEMRAGKKVKVAVQQGYAKVLLTIIDSHVTTLVAGFMLMEFGTGPVRGFAVTLCIGILANLFTAIFVSRAIFELYLGTTRRVETLSI